MPSAGCHRLRTRNWLETREQRDRYTLDVEDRCVAAVMPTESVAKLERSKIYG